MLNFSSSLLLLLFRRKVSLPEIWHWKIIIVYHFPCNVAECRFLAFVLWARFLEKASILCVFFVFSQVHLFYHLRPEGSDQRRLEENGYGLIVISSKYMIGVFNFLFPKYFKEFWAFLSLLVKYKDDDISYISFENLLFLGKIYFKKFLAYNSHYESLRLFLSTPLNFS